MKKNSGLNEVDSLLRQGDIEFNLGNPKKSRQLFEKVLEIESDNTHALLKIGNILGKIGSYEKAIEKYNVILKHEPFNPLALINKGLALHFLEKYSDAEDCYDTILKKKPKSSITLYFKASSLVKSQKIQLGFKILQQATEIDPSLKIKAKRDIDFQEIKTIKEFKKITS